MHKNAINWFEIPVVDLDRATQFYEKMLDRKLKREVFGSMPMAVFEAEQQNVGGALVYDTRRKPSADGPLVYLDTPELDATVGRAKKQGSEVLMEKTDIGEPGFIALIRDSEGNVVGLHQARG
jgi:predicted enzyme related to lactoylglutathione lyase